MGDRQLDVLVVDDDKSYASRVSRSLEGAGEGITGFVETDPETALARATDGQFDCLLCASSMPKLGGIELARVLGDGRPEVPVVVVSGDRSEAVAAEALRAGAADYLRKGLDDDTESLLGCVERAVETAGNRGDPAEFVRLARHDIRNPLSVAKGWLQTYRESGEESHYRYALEAIERIEEILDDFEALVGEETDALDRSSVDLATVATAAWEIVDPADARLRVDYDVRVEADASMLQTVLENLIENSVTHGSTNTRPPAADGPGSAVPAERGSPNPETDGVSEISAEHETKPDRDPALSADGSGPSDGTDRPAVTVEIRALDDGDGFYVADDGPGIPPEDRQQVFVRGQTGGTGTGMGLSIVGNVAAAHGWDVSLVESEAGGARFEFRNVPVVDHDGDEPASR